MKKTKLTPPDLKRCQADVPNGCTFMTFGGVPGLVRCTNTPVFIAIEKKKGRDGQKGSMSLCASCADVVEKQMPGHATLRRIRSVS